MTKDDIQLTGSSLILGPSNVGKTQLTACAFETWLTEKGTEGVVVLEFGPEFERDDRVLGRRLDRFVPIPDGVWHGILEARAPRAEGKTTTEALSLAQQNADQAEKLFEAVPENPSAVFVNDATIPFQATGNPTQLLTYCDTADCCVLNAFESDELGTDDPVSRNERQVLQCLEKWADYVHRLSQ